MNKQIICVATIFLLLSTQKSNGQQPPRKLSSDTVVYENVRAKTDVFILNTCDPSQVSFRRKYDDDSLTFSPKKKVRRLEVFSNRLSSFKIEGINPLRYKYYINSEAVTQFMDATAQTNQLSNFLREGYFTSPFDINVPQIFKEDLQRNNLRATLEPIERNIRSYKDSIWKYKAELKRISAEYPYPLTRFDKDYNALPLTNDEQARVKAHDDKSKPYILEFDRWANKLSDALEDYERLVMSLPISGTELSILRDYKTRTESEFRTNPKVRMIEKGIQEFSLRYDLLSTDFKSIDSLLNILKIGTQRIAARDSTEQLLAERLAIYGYTMPIQSYSISPYVNMSTINIKEFLIKKRYQVFEEFVLGTATKIGILLQSSFRELSQQTNSLKMQNCLNNAQIDSLRSMKKSLADVFDFVQKTSAEFQILVSYLDIDNKIYTDIAKSINGNYYSLLVFLKSIDLIETNNTVEFTLPSSSNLKNIDLVRYKVDREDKITGGKQSYTYDFWVRGGLKVDFSFGIFASGLIDNEYQKHQYDSAGSLTDSVQINRQMSGGYNFGFGGMVNVSPRLGSSWITPSLSFGVIYSTNQKLQFLSTLSINLGKTERIILHGGLAAGFVKTLDLSQHQITQIEDKNIYRVRANINDFSIPTIEKFTIRPVFGLTYNLSKKNALQAVSSSGLDKYRELNGEPGTNTVVP